MHLALNLNNYKNNKITLYLYLLQNNFIIKIKRFHISNYMSTPAPTQYP